MGFLWHGRFPKITTLAIFCESLWVFIGTFFITVTARNEKYYFQAVSIPGYCTEITGLLSSIGNYSWRIGQLYKDLEFWLVFIRAKVVIFCALSRLGFGIRHFYIAHNTPRLSQYPGEIGNNGYAKFWGLMNEVYYGQCESDEKALGSRASDAHNHP